MEIKIKFNGKDYTTVHQTVTVSAQDTLSGYLFGSDEMFDGNDFYQLLLSDDLKTVYRVKYDTDGVDLDCIDYDHAVSADIAFDESDYDYYDFEVFVKIYAVTEDYWTTKTPVRNIEELTKKDPETNDIVRCGTLAEAEKELPKSYFNAEERTTSGIRHVHHLFRIESFIADHNGDFVEDCGEGFGYSSVENLKDPSPNYSVLEQMIDDVFQYLPETEGIDTYYLTQTVCYDGTKVSEAEAKDFLRDLENRIGSDFRFEKSDFDRLVELMTEDRL